jgi:hypothetical protein
MQLRTVEDYAAVKQCFATFSSIRAYTHQSQILNLLRHVTMPNILLHSHLMHNHGWREFQYGIILSRPDWLVA